MGEPFLFFFRQWDVIAHGHGHPSSESLESKNCSLVKRTKTGQPLLLRNV